MIRTIIAALLLIFSASAAHAYDMGDGMTIEVSVTVIAPEDIGYMDYNSGRCYTGGRADAGNEVQCFYTQDPSESDMESARLAMAQYQTE